MASAGEPGAAGARIAAVGSRLTTAAGLAGIAFLILFMASFTLLRVGVPPPEGQAFATWWAANRDRIAAGTYLVPFVGIAFLWFVAAVRSRIGHGEGLFFSTIFLGSGLLYVATTFVVGAAAGATLAASEILDASRAAEVAAFSQAFGYALMFGFAVKMGGIFMLVVASIGRQTDAIARWTVFLSLMLGLGTLAISTLWDVAALVFPVWVGIVSLLIIRSNLAGAGGATPP